MATSVDTLKAPAGVSKDTLYQEVVRKDRAQKAAKEKEKKMERTFFGTMYRAGSGLVIALLGGFMIAKFPRIKSFDAAGKVQTRPILAGAALVGAFVTQDEASDVLEGVAMGFGLPFMSEWGGKLASMIGQ